MTDYIGWITDGLAVSVTVGAASVTLAYLMVAAAIVGGVLSFAIRRSKIR